MTTTETISVKRVTDEGACFVVVADFVWGPTRCGLSTYFVEQETGNDYPICRDHIEGTA